MAETTVKVFFVGDADKLKKSLGELDDAADKSGRNWGQLGKTAAMGLGALGVAGAGAVVHFGKMGIALDAMEKKAATVFEGSTGDVKAWADANAKAMGMTDDQLTTLAAGFGDLLKPMGFTADQAATMSKDVVGLSGALSAWSGGQRSAAEVAEILSAAMLGETDSLKGLGIAISAADIEARIAAKGQEELTGAALEQAKAIAIQELIFEKSADAQKAWADGSMDAVKSQNAVTSSLGELQEQIATRLAPVLERLTEFLVNTVIPAFDRLVAWVRDHWPEIQAVVQQVMDRVRTVIEGVLGAVEAFWRTWGGTITAFVTRMFDAIRQVVEGAMRAIQGVIDVVMGLIRGDWDRVWDGIRAIVSGVWQVINGLIDAAMAQLRALIEAGMRIIAGVFDAAWDGIRSAIGWALDRIVDFMQALPGRIVSAVGNLGELLVGAGFDVVNGLLRGMQAFWSFVVTGWLNIGDKIKSAIGDLGGLLVDIGKAIFQGLWDGMKAVWGDMTGWLGDVAGKIGGVFKGVLGINSPSRVMAEIGENTMKGLELGLGDGWGEVAAAVSGMADSITGHLTAGTLAGPSRGANGVVGAMLHAPIAVEVHVHGDVRDRATADYTATVVAGRVKRELSVLLRGG